MKHLGGAEIDRKLGGMRVRGEVANHGASLGGAGSTRIERHDCEIRVTGADQVEVYMRGRGDIGKDRFRRRPIGKEIDFKCTARAHQGSSESGHACRHAHRGQTVESFAHLGQVCALRMAHFSIERISDDAEFVASGCAVDYFESFAARLVKSSGMIVVVARGHRGAEVEHQRVNAAVSYRRWTHQVHAGDRESQRRKGRHLEPEKRIETHVLNTRDGRRRFIEEHQARDVEGGARARAQIDQYQQREAEGVNEVLRT